MLEIAQRLLAQCRIWQQQERRRGSHGNLDLVWPAELLHWERTLEELGPARARLLWQAGQVSTILSSAVYRQGVCMRLCVAQLVASAVFTSLTR